MVVDKDGHIYWHYNAAGFEWIIEFNEGEKLHPVTIIGEEYESTAKIDAIESREDSIVFTEFVTDAPALVAGTIGGLFEITAGSIFLMAEYMLPTEVDFADLGFVNYYNK